MAHDSLSERVGREQGRATLKFLALLVVLLVVPDREFGVLFGLNPSRVWLVVVFVAGLSFLGYLLSQVLDAATSIVLTGVLGGSVSPGLTITSLAEQARRYPEFASVYACAGAIAATMLFARNLAVVAIVSLPLARSLLGPFLAMAVVGVAVAVVSWRRVTQQDPPADGLDTPFEIRSALAIGSLVAVVLVVVEIVDLSLPAQATWLGVVLATVVQLGIYTTVAWTAGVPRMARVLAVVLVGSASAGVAVVLVA